MAEWCTACGGFLWSGKRHMCPPAWDVWCPERDGERGDASPTHAYNAREAAQKWAERDDRDSCDYTIVGGDVVIVHVAAVSGDDVRRFTVSGESVPQYHAEEVGGDDG